MTPIKGTGIGSDNGENGKNQWITVKKQRAYRGASERKADGGQKTTTVKAQDCPNSAKPKLNLNEQAKDNSEN